MADVTSRLRLVVDSTGVDKAGRKLKDLRKGAHDADAAAARLRSTFAGLAGVLGAAFSTQQLVKVADQYRGIQNQLRLVTGSASELLDVQRKVLGVANETGASLDSTVRLYANLERFAGDFLKTQQDTLDLTRAINQTAVISGASVTEAGNAVRQLSQAIAGGVLRAEEFNSIIENMPRLGEAVAAGLGVSIGGLRKQVNEGLVTSEKLISALQSQFDVINQEFLGSAKTIGQALQVVGNMITVELGQRLQGVQQVAIDALQFIGANISNLMPLFEGLAASIIAVGAAFTFPAAVAAIGAILSPLGLLAIAIGAVVAFRDDIAEWAFGVHDAGIVVRAAIEVLGPMFADLLASIRTFATNAIPYLAEFARGAVESLQLVGASVAGLVGVMNEAFNRVEIDVAKRKLQDLADQQKALTEGLRELAAEKFVTPGIEIARADIIAELDIVNNHIAETREGLQELLNPPSVNGLGNIVSDTKEKIEELKNASTEIADAPGPERMRKEVEKLSTVTKAAATDANELANIFRQLEIEREAILAGGDTRDADIIRTTAALLKEQSEHYKTMGANAAKVAQADAERIVDLRRSNKELEAQSKLAKEIAEQHELIAAARLGERQERIAQEILSIRREIGRALTDEEAALAKQNVYLDEQLEIIREQRAIIEAPFENLADNLRDAIINGGSDGVKGLKGVFKAFIKDLKTSFLDSLFQPLFTQIRNLSSGIAVPIFGPQAGIGGASQTLAQTATGAQALGGAGGVGGFNLGSLSALAPALLGTALGGSSAVFGIGNLLSSTGAIGRGVASIGNFLGLSGGLTDSIAGGLSKAFSPGNALGGIAGGLLSSAIFGNSTASSIGSSLGGVAGSFIPFLPGPIGSAIGSFLGGAIGSLFSSGGAALTFDLNSGKESFKNKGQALGDVQELGGAFTQIAQQFASLLGSEISDTLGIRIRADNGSYLPSVRNLQTNAVVALPAGAKGVNDTITKDPEEALRIALGLTVDKIFEGGDATLKEVAKALLKTNLSIEEIGNSLQTIAELTKLGEKPLSEYAQRLKDLNATFDQAIAAAGNVSAAETALAGAREKATQALRQEFSENVLAAELSRTDSILAGFRELVKGNADLLADDLALNGSGALTAALRTGNFEDFFAQALQAGESVADLAARMAEFQAVVMELGGDVSALSNGFEQAKLATRDLFNEQVQGDLGNFLNGPADQLEKLLQAQAERAAKAEEIGADLVAVERLTALELRQFFQGLSDQALQEVQSFLGLFEEASASVARNLDLSRQDLEGQRDSFAQFAQDFSQIRTDFAERFVAASPRESLDILRARANDLLGQVGDGNASAAQALPQVLNNLVENARQSFGNTKQFQQVLDFANSIATQAEDASLKVVSETERQIMALDESNDLLSDIRDILASSQAANAFLASYSSGGIASSDELLNLIQQGAGLTLASNDNAAALNITSLIGQSLAPIMQPLTGAVDRLTQQMSEMPNLMRLQIENDDRNADRIVGAVDDVYAVLDRLETLEKRQLQELEAINTRRAA